MAIAAGNTEWQNNVIRLKRDAIRRVDIVELPYKYRGDYCETALDSALHSRGTV